MGLLFNRDSGGADTSKEEALLAEEEARTKREQDRVNAQRQKEYDDKLALSNRNKNMQGGGRSGLMFGGQRQGVA